MTVLWGGWVWCLSSLTMCQHYCVLLSIVIHVLPVYRLPLWGAQGRWEQGGFFSFSDIHGNSFIRTTSVEVYLLDSAAVGTSSIFSGIHIYTTPSRTHVVSVPFPSECKVVGTGQSYSSRPLHSYWWRVPSNRGAWSIYLPSQAAP